MVTEAELSDAIQAGSQFQQAVLSVRYLREQDTLVFHTPWGFLGVNRQESPWFRDVDPDTLGKIYVSQTGIHLDEIDLDINSAGLLEELLRNARDALKRSF